MLVVGNPANTNCLIAQKSAPSIPAANFTCLTRLDMNRAKAQVSWHVIICSRHRLAQSFTLARQGCRSWVKYPSVDLAFPADKRIGLIFSFQRNPFYLPAINILPPVGNVTLHPCGGGGGGGGVNKGMEICQSADSSACSIFSHDDLGVASFQCRL